MVVFKCEFCNYTSKYKYNYNKHINTKKHRLRSTDKNICSYVYGLVNTNEHKMNTNEHKMNTDNYVCQYCSNIFRSKASCRRHEKKYCKLNPNLKDKILELKNIKIKELEKEKEEWKNEKHSLYKKMDILLEKIGDTNIQQNISLNNYGKEDISHISNSLKNEYLKIPYGAIPKMIKDIHFNDKKPENKNIIFPNKNQPLVKVYKDDKWIYKNKNETINELVDNNFSIMDDHYEVVTETNIEPGIITNFIKFKRYYEEGDKAMIEDLKKECELVLLNNSDRKIDLKVI